MLDKFWQGVESGIWGIEKKWQNLIFLEQSSWIERLKFWSFWDNCENIKLIGQCHQPTCPFWWPLVTVTVTESESVTVFATGTRTIIRTKPQGSSSNHHWIKTIGLKHKPLATIAVYSVVIKTLLYLQPQHNNVFFLSILFWFYFINSLRDWSTCLKIYYNLVHLFTDSLSGWSRRESGGGAELPQQQAKDCDCLLWPLDKVRWLITLENVMNKDFFIQSLRIEEKCVSTQFLFFYSGLLDYIDMYNICHYDCVTRKKEIVTVSDHPPCLS